MKDVTVAVAVEVGDRNIAPATQSQLARRAEPTGGARKDQMCTAAPDPYVLARSLSEPVAPR
jgi:hypothetical protein